MNTMGLIAIGLMCGIILSFYGIKDGLAFIVCLAILGVLIALILRMVL